MKSAIDFFYQHAGHVLRPYMDAETAFPDDICGVCERPNVEWLEPAKKVSFTQYGQKEDHCLSCHSLYEGNVDLFGVERLTKSGSPVAMKLGMATGCGALVTANETVLFLNNFIKKMQLAKSPPFEMRAMFGLEAYKYIVNNLPTDSEYLFIGNFGRVKQGLVNNLRLSTPDRLYICEDSQQLEIPTKIMNEMISASSRLPARRKKSLKDALDLVYAGKMSPLSESLTKQLQALRVDYPEVLEATKGLPDDPHHCLNILKLW